jgi:hypothetical protein
MEDFNSETDSDYTSYWRDWVSGISFIMVLRLGVDHIAGSAQRAREKAAALL